ncbi:MAG TPA: hypothetical protein VNV88_06350 [Candidatus Solibacter sp.]|jgi:hypothetical protein|nr:hypothetical protein [Candidatus Solibacter sp.]
MKWGRFKRLWMRVRNKIAVITVVVFALLLLPPKGHGQFGIDLAVIQTGLSVISNLLQSVVAKPLAAIQQIEQQAANFEQQVVWPISAINQAKATINQLQGVLVRTRQIWQVPIASATLPTPKKLEQALLSANPGAISQVSANYTAVYGAVPAPTDAPQPVRDLMDMTDAEAQAAMKKAVELDALANVELQTAEQINQQLQGAAPGSAAILEAQTSAWVVRANAYTQSALAELMRVRSISLANQGAQLKFSANHTSNLRSTSGQVLQPAAR